MIIRSRTGSLLPDNQAEMNIDIAKSMKNLVAKGIKIPPQPRVLVELRKMLAKDDTSARALARVINEDLGISAMLFRAARSPVFGRSKKFASIEDVIITVGVRQTFNLVQSMALTCSVSNRIRNGPGPTQHLGRDHSRRFCRIKLNLLQMGVDYMDYYLIEID